MNKILRAVIGSAASALVLVACTSQQVGKETPQVVDPASTSTIEFGIGTFNQVDTGYSNGNSQNSYVTLNVVGSLRNPQGQTAVLSDTPTIIGPTNFIVNQAAEKGGPNQILKALANFPLFGDGFGNVGAGLNANLTQSTNSNIAQTIGGPPAWPSVNSGLYPPQFIGYPESVWRGGLLDSTGTPFVPVAGTYTLQVTIPVGENLGVTNEQLSAATAMTNVTPLPPFPTPQFAPDGNGGGTVTIDVPSGVTEAFVNFTVTNQLCYPSTALVITGGGSTQPSSQYTLMTRSTGVQTLVLPDNLGPPNPTTGLPLHTMCTKNDNTNDALQPPTSNVIFGAQYSLYAVGVDYPAYEQSYPQSTSPTPQLTGANGQADATASDLNHGQVNYP